MENEKKSLMENEKKSNAYRLAYSLPPLYSPDFE
jgi:hypothetical protein